MADNLLDKASILLTPTAYRDGGMLSVKPNENLYGSELVTNGDFATDSNWTKLSNTTISGGKANFSNADFVSLYQNVGVSSGLVKATFSVTDYTSGSLKIYVGGYALGTSLISATSVGSYSAIIDTSGGNGNIIFGSSDNFTGSIDNVSVKEDLSGDFTFSRSSAATRVNAQGLVENVQIISSELVSNGNFSQIGTEEVLNGNFSQEGSEIVTNGDFATDSDWSKGTGWSISDGVATYDGTGGTQSLVQGNIQNIELGKLCKVTIDVLSNEGNGANTIFLGGTVLNGNHLNVGSHTFFGSFTSNTNFYVYGRSGEVFKIDNVSIKEVAQNWDLGSGWSIGEDKAKVDNTSANYISQDGIVSDTKTYAITFTILNYISGSIRLRLGNTYGDYVSGDGTYTKYIQCTASNKFRVYSAPSGANLSITNISVKEVGQDWTLGTGWSIGDDEAIFNETTTNRIFQTGLSIISGKKYKIGFTIADCPTTAHMTIYDAGGSDLILPNENYVNGDYTRYYTATTNETGVSFWGNTAGDTFTISNISLKEITDDTNIPRINYEGFSYQDSLGSELVTNGDFAISGTPSTNTYTLGWYSNTANVSITNGNLILTNSVSENSSRAYITNGVSSTTVLITNKSYKLQYEIVANNGVSALNYVVGSIAYAAPTTIGTHIIYFESGLAATFQLRNRTTNSNIVFDNVSVKEYLGQEVVPDSGCGSWLLEPQRTNKATYSEDFSNAYWTKSNASVVSGFASPDGNNNAYKLVEGAINSEHYVRSGFINTTDGGSIIPSIFVKSAERSQVVFKEDAYTGQFMTVDLIAETISTNGENANLTKIANGWFRIDFKSLGKPSTRWKVSPAVNSTSTYQGDGTSGIYIFGFQLEDNVSYATSYIPTNGATNTRLQDIANNSGNSTLINSTEGVLYAEVSKDTTAIDGGVSISDGTYSNRVLFYFSTSGDIRAYVYSSGLQAIIVKNGLDYTQNNKLAVKYSATSTKFFVNGSLVGEDTSSTMPVGLNQMNFHDGGEGSPFYGKAKALAVYKEALTDANLRSLTYPNPVATTFDLDFDTIAEQFTFTRGSEATFVNAQGLIESTASNDAPRIDYSTGAKAFLLEPQSTNLITYSSDFSNAYWSKTSGGAASSPVVTSNYAISPDGTLNADRLIFDIGAGGSSSDISQLQSPNFVMAGDYSNSVYLKSNTGDDYVFTYTTPSGGSTSITITSEWKRFENTATSNTTTRAFKLRLRGSESTSSYADISIYGAQLEQLSYATSYIPTSGASATRNQELCNNATPVINSEEGTLYAEISALANDGTIRFLGLNDGSNNNRVVILYHSGNNNIRAILSSGSTKYVDVSSSVTSVLDFHKVAIRYSSSEFSLWIDGVKVATETSLNAPIGLDRLDFELSGSPFFGNTKGLKYYPKALADVQLEDLTTI